MNTNSNTIPLVSIVLTIYNTQEFLRQCLDSLLQQSLKDIEIISINDGSTDDSLRILQEYAAQDSRIRVFTQTNKGAALSRNFGLTQARGKYVQFLDSDDFFDPCMLQTLVQRAEKTNAQITTCRSRAYRQKTGSLSLEEWTLRTDLLPQGLVFSHSDIPNHIFQWTNGWAWDKLYLTSFVKDNTLEFQDLRATNDLVFTYLSLILANRIAAVPEYLITHRTELTGSISNRKNLYPFCFYHAWHALQKEMKKRNLWEFHKYSFINQALKHTWWYFKTVDIKDHKNIYRALHDYILDEWDFINFPSSAFNNQELYYRFHFIKKFSYPNLFAHFIILRYQYYRCKILSKITWGNKRKHYKQKRDKLHEQVRQIYALLK